jgi:hypothetical protein
MLIGTAQGSGLLLSVLITSGATAGLFDPVLTCLDASMFEDMHEHVAFVNDQYSLEAEQRCNEAVALALHDISHGRLVHGQSSHCCRGDWSSSPPYAGSCDHACQSCHPNNKLSFPGSSQGSSSSPVCIICGAPGHKAAACRATMTCFGKHPVTTFHNQKLVTVSGCSSLCFSFDILSCVCPVSILGLGTPHLSIIAPSAFPLTTVPVPVCTGN